MVEVLGATELLTSQLLTSSNLEDHSPHKRTISSRHLNLCSIMVVIVTVKGTIGMKVKMDVKVKVSHHESYCKEEEPSIQPDQI